MSDDRRGEWNDQYVAEQDEDLEDAAADLDMLSYFVVDYGIDLPGDEEDEDIEDWWDDDHGESLGAGLDED
jgi:hypothetical protein